MHYTTHRFLPFFIGILYLLLAISSVQFDDITYDEQDHLNYGIRLLKGKSSRQQPGADFNTTMPVSILNALPRAAEQLVHPTLEKKDGGESDAKQGRYITILATLLLLAYLYFFGKAIAGHVAGCWAMLLAALDPNILAHSRLVTTDLYGTLAWIATLFHLHQWLHKKENNHFYYWCIALAISQCCKINNILLYPICLLSILGYQFYNGFRLSGKKVWLPLLSFVLIQLFIINIAFLFYHTGMPLDAYAFKSNFFRELQHQWISVIPIPLPQSFIDTFDLTLYERESFTGTAQNYLIGEWRYQKGFWNYYFFCWMVKTPLLTGLLVFTSAITSLVNKQFRRQSIYFLIIPSAIVLLLLSSSSVQSGYRYLLPVLAASLVSAGVFIQKTMSRLPKHTGILISIGLGTAVLLSFPNYISYTSEWQWPKKNAYRYLSDSNLNWGQRQKKIQQILQQNPDYHFEPLTPVTGQIVVDINKVTGIIDTEKFAWLRNNYSPIAVIEGCYLLYEVKELPR